MARTRLLSPPRSGTFYKKLDKNIGIYYNMPMKKSITDEKSEKYKKITRIFLEQKGYARTTELQKKGIHQRDINMLLADGALIKIKNGLFRYADTPIVSHQGFIDISQAVPGGVICLLSALSFYELTTFNPTVISVAIHRKNWKPRVEYPPVEFFFFSREQYEAGIEEYKIGGFRIPIYCPEKTICDCFRYRNKLGLDTAKEGLTLYLRRKDRNIEKLLKYAVVCRVKPLIETWLHAMTW
jgi:predicted transcriptional regulator of viral defense system